MTEKGFIGALFDLSFNTFVTIKIVRFLYILAMISAGLAALGVLVQGIRAGGAMTLVGLFGAIVVFLVGILLARVYMEVLMVVFRIAENTSIMVEKMTGEEAPALAPDDEMV